MFHQIMKDKRQECLASEPLPVEHVVQRLAMDLQNSKQKILDRLPGRSCSLVLALTARNVLRAKEL